MCSSDTFTVEAGKSSVQCGPDQKMLDAFLRNGVWVPNSCNQGTCGTCKVRVVRGTVDHPPAPDTVLSIAEQEQGFVLSCQTTPASDVVIDPPAEETGSPRHVLRDIAGTVGAVTSIADDTVSVTVLFDEPLEFTAGQYVELTVPGTVETRPYSMANPPSEPDKLEFHIRRQPGGLATEGWIFESLDVGDPVTNVRPVGRFLLRAGGVRRRVGPAGRRDRPGSAEGHRPGSASGRPRT
ncbi:putative phenol hydroxylase reductase component [Gordonia amicalis NBRC 100051 = JCM 11271]|nr:putative phenol hydroxylase reductase component [Gordonia amicalis NBRC 100051 = JCM 11271]